MTRLLTLRPLAEADLVAIWDYTVSRWSAARAEMYLAGLRDMLELLSEHPEIARLHDFDPPLRLFRYRSHLVIFTADELALEVIRVVHKRLNWQVLLAE